MKLKGWLRKKINNMSLEAKIRTSFVLLIIPVLLLLIGVTVLLSRENKRYDDVVNAAGSASQFSLSFKDDFDYETYLVIVESKSFEESELLRMLDEATEVVDNLIANVDSGSKNIKELENTKKYLTNLATYTERIRENLGSGDKYDTNIEIWENDVQIVTSLIRESIIKFIYNELQDIRTARDEMNMLFYSMLRGLVIASVIVTMLVMMLSYYVARSITRPITHLSSVTEKVSRGDLSVRANTDVGAEVGVLSKSLNDMIDRINKLLDQVKEEQISLRETELELLQSQINPHFLYNTLDTIVWLAESGDQQQVVKMVGSLSDFFRTTLNSGRDIVTIKDELRHVGSYLEIQQVRYQDILDYDISVDESLYKYTIPKITLQPLVENALYHGIKNKRGKGHISVTGEMGASYFNIYVEDNGIGIPEDRLEQIQNKINNTSDEDDEVFGLHNVNERIRLKFGNRYGIHVESEYGKGTRVGVMLPLDVLEIEK